MKIEPSSLTDLPQIKELVYASFLNEEHTDHLEQQLVERIMHSAGFVPELSLVARQEGEIVGYALFSEITLCTDSGDRTVLALAPASVSRTHQKQGIGSALINEGHKRATQMGYPLVALLGHPTYYPRFGYEMSTKYGITFPFDVPAEYCMVKILNKTDLPTYSSVVYPDTF